MKKQFKLIYGTGINRSTDKIPLPQWDYIYLIHSCQYQCEYIQFRNKYIYILEKTKELIEIEFQ